ncbi:WD repeat-containing protein 74 [Chamberlinius hualienensis]
MVCSGINSQQKGFVNLNSVKNVSKTEDEIEVMGWKDEDQTQICYGVKSRTVKTYNTVNGDYQSVLKVEGGQGSFKGLSVVNGNYLSCVESGLVKLWNAETAEEMMELNVGPNVYRMKHNSYFSSQIATGGKENELKIWDLENTKQPIFKAKNVKRDSLDLRVPIWVTDMQFISEGQKIVTATGHHQIRLYDPKSSQKRPVIDMEFDEYPFTSIAVANQENYVIAGNTRGRMALFDLRKKLMVHCYKGFAGSIRSIQCHPSAPLVASCGLDRFLRIHDVNNHLLIKKVYLKSRLNCLLYRNEVVEPVATKSAKRTDINVNEDIDDLWNKMEAVNDDENLNKKKRIFTANKRSFKLKKKLKMEN